MIYNEHKEHQFSLKIKCMCPSFIHIFLLEFRVTCISGYDDLSKSYLPGGDGVKSELHVLRKS